MRSEDLADNVFVVLTAYVAVGIPLNLYLYHDVIDTHWRPVADLRRYSIRYGAGAIVALVLLFLYGLLQFAAQDYKEGGAAFLSGAVAVYGLYLSVRQRHVLNFFDDHLQRRVEKIVAVYKNARGIKTEEAKLLFPEGDAYQVGEAGGHLSSEFLDDNYPGDSPRVTWLRREPEVKDLTEMAVRTGLWVRLAVTSASNSFDIALRPRQLANKKKIDSSGVWTLTVIQQHFERGRERNERTAPRSIDLKTFTEWVDGKKNRLAEWRKTLSLAPESEWKEALAEFPTHWTEGLKEKGIAFEVYLALALTEPLVDPTGSFWLNRATSHRVAAFCCCCPSSSQPPLPPTPSLPPPPTRSTSNPIGNATINGSRLLPGRDEFREKVEGLLHAVLGNEGFVTPAVLMASFPLDEPELGWLTRLQRLAEKWLRLAWEIDSAIPHDTDGVDVVVGLALLLGAKASCFEFSLTWKKDVKDSQVEDARMMDLLEERRKLVLLTIQDVEAGTLLKESLKRLERRKAAASEIAQGQYSLGKFLQAKNRYAEAHDYFDLAIKTWEDPRSNAKRRSALISKAQVFEKQAVFQEAERFYKLAAVDKHVEGCDGREVIKDLTNIGRVLVERTECDPGSSICDLLLGQTKSPKGGRGGRIGQGMHYLPLASAWRAKTVSERYISS
ncbi:unnamed protein product [Scytosiphon promiscuus]